MPPRLHLTDNRERRRRPFILAPTMLVLRLILGLSALALLHAVLFAQMPASARARARRTHR